MDFFTEDIGEANRTIAGLRRDVTILRNGVLFMIAMNLVALFFAVSILLNPSA